MQLSTSPNLKNNPSNLGQGNSQQLNQRQDFASEPIGVFSRRSDAIGKKANDRFLKVVGFGFLAFFIWAATTSLNEVTRGSGRIVPLEQNRNIQHMEGGIITDIMVVEGARVKAGDVLVSIKNSFSIAELEQNKLELAFQRIKLARLSAEAKGDSLFITPNDMIKSNPEIVEQELKIFDSRRASRQEQMLIFKDQALQKRLTLSERRQRLENKRKEYQLLLETVKNFRGLEKSGAVSRNELLRQESSLQQLVTQLNDLEFQIPKVESELKEALRRQNEVELRFRSEAESESALAAVNIAKLNETISAMQDRSIRTNVIAPIDGRINRLLVSTIGGVVQPGQALATIVPDDLSIAIDARLSPKDRASVWPGLEAVLKISAYDYTIYGGLKGEVIEISPDALIDEKGNPYFRVRVRADASGFGESNPIVPGMTAEVNILTGKHSVLDYLLRPVRRLKENALQQ